MVKVYSVSEGFPAVIMLENGYNMKEYKRKSAPLMVCFSGKVFLKSSQIMSLTCLMSGIRIALFGL